MTEAGQRLLQQLSPALDVINGFRDRPIGTLRLTVPKGAAHLLLLRILPQFMAEFPDIKLEIATEGTLVDLLADGYDAGIRFGERLEQDMIAIPIGPRVQRFATAATSEYLDRNGRPRHPEELLGHACLRCRFSSGVLAPWEFEKNGDIICVEPGGPLTVRGLTELGVSAALAGSGVIHLYEEWLRPYLDKGFLETVLEP